MSQIVRSALVQAAWTGEYETMLDTNIAYARQAADDGARVLCFQEIFTGPYFCNVQDPSFYDLAEPIPDGPTVTAMMKLAKETSMVIIVPIYERVDEGTFYNTAAVIDADGTLLGMYRKTHIPQVEGFWEKFYFRPGNLGYPVFDTAVGRIGVYICYDRHFPEGWRELGLKGAKIVFNPSATTRGHSKYLWQLEQPAAAVANQYFVGAINRIGAEDLVDTDYYGSSYFVDPRGQIVGDAASDTQDEVVVRDLDMSEIEAARRHWAFYRDRRPEVYEGIAKS
ncbi:MAG: acyltransferase [Actinomycetia bacterium]|nr:acyltransferase [Actinomycetes bacterium]